MLNESLNSKFDLGFFGELDNTLVIETVLCYYSALSPVLSTNVVYVKTQQKHAKIKHHDRTKQ